MEEVNAKQQELAAFEVLRSLSLSVGSAVSAGIEVHKEFVQVRTENSEAFAHLDELDYRRLELMHEVLDDRDERIADFDDVFERMGKDEWRQFPDLAMNNADRTIAAVCALYRSVLELEEIVDHLRCEIDSHVG